MAAPTSDVANDKPTVGYYPWVLVGLLWFCGFFNYADRQALSAVFPLLKAEFGLSDTQLGSLGTAFMVPYALAAAFAGLVVDRTSKKKLVVFGLGFWSLICVATGWAWSFYSLVGFRAAEGLGEAFYFPASMTLIAAFHGGQTRSRAMSIHQTSVYFGITIGGIFAAYLGKTFGWRTPFYGLGWVGMIFAVALWPLLKEPGRRRSQSGEPTPVVEERNSELVATRGAWYLDVWNVISNPAALLLLLVFSGANFVTASLFTWLPLFVYRKFEMDLTAAAFYATLFIQGGSFIGALLGGVLADWFAQRWGGGRAAVQGAGLLIGAPFVYLVATTTNVPLLATSLTLVGLCKGLYEANIFASVFDVVVPSMRGVTAGLMNTLGWALASIATLLIGIISDKYSLSFALSLTSIVYGVAGISALFGSHFLVAPRAISRLQVDKSEPDPEF